jgi:hypothetical protein
MPLCPKTYWRYLGFYFDHKLNFHKHVQYYVTKSISMVKAMKMLSSSTHGLTPTQKQTLYQACVVPIAMYGFCLWFYDGAKTKGAIKSLTTMQQQAALWITGAFKTSPTGDVEALAGLIPIQLHLQKLAHWVDYCITMLAPNHPLHALLSRENARSAPSHPRSITGMSLSKRAKVTSSLMHAETHMR